MAEMGTDTKTSAFLFRKLDEFKTERQASANDEDEKNMFCGIQSNELVRVPVGMGAVDAGGKGQGKKGKKAKKSNPNTTATYRTMDPVYWTLGKCTLIKATRYPLRIHHLPRHTQRQI